MVPLGLLRQLGAWWSSGEATRWPVAVLVLLGLAAVAVGVASFRLPPDRPLVRAGAAAALLLVLLYLFALTLQLLHPAAAAVFRMLGWTNWGILLVVAPALILYRRRLGRSALV